MVKIEFIKGEAPLIFSDALHLTEEEYQSLTEADIEAMKEARYASWLAIITALPVANEEIVDG